MQIFYYNCLRTTDRMLIWDGMEYITLTYPWYIIFIIPTNLSSLVVFYGFVSVYLPEIRTPPISD